ncbi:hypothetical protein GCM10027276_13630 [Comamonas piscis]
MYVILTSKPGQYHTQANADIQLIEAWDYHFCGRLLARFALGELLRETKVQVIEEGPGGTTNRVPSKFLERFDSLEQARQELQHLCQFGALDATLTAAPLTAPTAA